MEVTDKEDMEGVGVVEDRHGGNMEREGATRELLFVAVSLIGYTLVQYYAFSWNFTNLFVGIGALTLCIVYGNCIARKPLVRVAVNLSAIYCAVVAGLLFYFRIQI
jgi:hypothetical protein